MISEIFIKNYILIDELELKFSRGLNIITGETGAGKSILVNAIDIAFGAKAGKEVIKTGTDKAVIELTVLNKKHNLTPLFEEYGIDDNGEEIVISREISQTGSRSRINGCLVNAEVIKIFRGLFLDIHTQHQTYSFLQPKTHITLLDSYIKDPSLDIYKKDFAKYRDMLSKLEDMKNSADKTEEQIDFLKFQLNEITEACIASTNEDSELENELAVLENVEKLKDLTGSSYWTLSGDDGSILDGLAQVRLNISKAVSTDNSLESTESGLTEAAELLKSVSAELREYSNSLENDEERINTIQERLFLLNKLKRKYGGSLDKVLIQSKNFKKELDGIEFSTKNIEDLEAEITELRRKLEGLAEEISERRKGCASELSEQIVRKLEKLELPKVKFEIHFEKCELSPYGADKAEFLISANVSEGLKPLAQTASGGEISRVVLAVKTIFAESDNTDTVIFDEIDTGISGKTSQAVAEEVKGLSEYMQVIMITHQAIIASKSDRHFYVKKTQDGKTSVDISVLEGDEKLNAIAELASGEANENSLKFAQTLVNSSLQV